MSRGDALAVVVGAVLGVTVFGYVLPRFERSEPRGEMTITDTDLEWDATTNKIPFHSEFSGTITVPSFDSNPVAIYCECASDTICEGPTCEISVDGWKTCTFSYKEAD